MNVMSAWLHCKACGRVLDVTPHDFLVAWLRGQPSFCGHCNTEIPVWQSVLEAIADEAFGFRLASFLGGGTAWFNVTLRRDERCNIRLSDHGVPADAIITDINYTPNASLFPCEQHGNSPMAPRDRHQISLWPVPYDNDVQEAECQVAVSWLPASMQDQSQDMIIEAARRFRAQDYRGAILWSHTALDEALAQVVGPLLTTCLADDGFPMRYPMPKLAVLQAAVAAAGARPLDKDLLALLKALNTSRNRVAHPPKGMQFDQKRTGELLAAAVFALTYVQVMRRLIEDVEQAAKRLIDPTPGN